MLRVKSFLIPLFFHALLLGVIPWWITGGLYVRPGSLGLLAIPGSLLGLAGILLIVRTALLFADVGQGTPSPFHPPGKLVVKGPFRWMRHPLYAGVLLIAFGEALATVSSKLLIYAVSLTVAIQLLVVIIEEPVLRKRFGDVYDVYCAKVPRWIPKLRNEAPPEQDADTPR